MNSIVCVRRTPDTETQVKIAADGAALDPAGVKWIVNPYDEFAIEQAVKLKEAAGQGQVTLLCLSADDPTKELRSGLAIGADKAVVLKDGGEPRDSFGVAHALAGQIRAIGLEGLGAIFFGKVSADDQEHAVGPMVATLLDLPCVSGISAFAVDGARATVERPVEGGVEVIAVPLPAVFTCDKALGDARYASLKGIMQAKKKPVETVEAPPVPAKLIATKLALPAPRAAGRIVGEGADAVPALIEALRNEAKVL